MTKSLIEELAGLKDLFEMESAEADILRRAMFRLDEQERIISSYQKQEKRGPVFTASHGAGGSRLDPELLEAVPAKH